MKEAMRLRQAVSGRVWCLDEQCMRQMLGELPARLMAATTAAPNSRASLAMTSKGGSVAVIPIRGVIEPGGGFFSMFFGGTSPEFLSAQIAAAVADPNVEAIVLDVDSPGGSVSGVEEVAAEIYAARKVKPITAVSNGMMASAAYFLGSQASELIASPSSLTGSIGVYTLHEDDSQLLDNLGVTMTFVYYGENKTAGNSYEPLTDTARGHMQETVDSFGQAFDKAVARGRGVSVDDVSKRFGQGRIFTAQKAVKLGLADRVGTLDDALAKHGAKRPSGMRGAVGVPISEVVISAASAKKTKRVDGEDLELDAFAYQGDPEKTEDWHLPIEFSTEEKTVKHIRNAVARWSQTEMPDKAEKDRARERIRKAAKEHDIELADDDLKGEESGAPISASASRRRALELVSI
jgi:signal peptide peptidase SppA